MKISAEQKEFFENIIEEKQVAALEAHLKPLVDSAISRVIASQQLLLKHLKTRLPSTDPLLLDPSREAARGLPGR